MRGLRGNRQNEVMTEPVTSKEISPREQKHREMVGKYHTVDIKQQERWYQIL